MIHWIHLIALGWVGSLRVRQFRASHESDTNVLSLGDRVLWFRAEAEMYRWLEQAEIKHVQFVRLVTSFRRMGDVWERLADVHKSDAGKQTFALKQSAIFRSREKDACSTFYSCGLPDLLPRSVAMITTKGVIAELCDLSREHRRLLERRITAVAPEYKFIWAGES